MLFIEPDAYRRWLDEARLHAGNSTLLERAYSPDAAARLNPGKRSVGDIAVVNLNGFITQKPNIFTMLFGGTSTEGLVETMRAALTEPSVGSIVLNVDSPGGIVFGVPEAAAAIRGMRGKKPIVAVANPLMASAAYYLGAQADQIVAIPSSIVGSVGVMVAHVDESEALKEAGLNVSLITYGRRKAEETSVRPLGEEAKDSIQARVDYYGRLFEEDVAKGRGVSVQTVRKNFGEGAVFTARDAQANGLVDRIGTLEEVLGRLAAGERMGARASTDTLEIAARAALAGVKMGESR